MSDITPDLSQQLRTIAGRVISGPALDSFVEIALISAFTEPESGVIDEGKVMGHLTAIHRAGQPEQPQPAQWGQYSGTVPGPLPGAHGRAEAARRHGRQPPDEIAITAARFAPDSGSAEAQRRIQKRRGRR